MTLENKSIANAAKQEELELLEKKLKATKENIVSESELNYYSWGNGLLLGLPATGLAAAVCYIANTVFSVPMALEDAGRVIGVAGISTALLGSTISYNLAKRKSDQYECEAKNIESKIYKITA